MQCVSTPTTRSKRVRSRSSLEEWRRSRPGSCSTVPGLCAFATRGPSRYFGGDHTLATQVLDAVAAALGDSTSDVRIGVADGGFTARLAARRAAPGSPFVVEPDGSAAFCAPWPVAVLDDPDLASLLVRLGLPTLGAVAALPADAVLARFGAEGRRFHDLARGVDPGPPVLVTPPPDLVEQTELDPPVAAGRRRRVRGEGARRAVAVPPRRARPGVHARGDRGRDRAR